MKNFKIATLEALFLVELAFVLLLLFGFGIGWKATGEMVADIFIFHQYTWWMVILAFSTITVGILAPLGFNSTGMFGNSYVRDILMGAVVMVVATFVVWVITLMIIALLGEFGKIFLKYFSDFMAGFSSRH